MIRPHCQNPDSCAARSPTTHCRRCAAKALLKDPARRARQKAGVERRFADPVKRARAVEVAKRNISSWLNRPETREYLRKRAREIHPLTMTPEALAKNRAKRAQAGRKASMTKLPWCPPHKLDAYRFLTERKRIPAAEARQIIEDELSRERALVYKIKADMEAREARRRRDAY